MPITFVLTPYCNNYYNFDPTSHTFRILLLVLICIALPILMSRLQKAFTPRWAKGLSYNGGIVLLLFFLMELFFSWLPQSLGNGKAFVEHNWLRKYWGTPNSMGYRDAEPEDNGKPKLMVLGDSFVEGHGIEKRGQRFSNILKADLKDQFQVYNLGRGGSNTRDEFERLQQYPHTPDVLFLSYFSNDIMDIPPSGDPPPPFPMPDEDLSSISRYFVEHTFSMNYLFWKFIAPAKFGEVLLEKTDYNPVFRYLDEQVLSQHTQDLEKFIGWSRENNVRLVVVVFPNLSQGGIAISSLLVCKPIADFFQQQGIEVVNVYDLVKALPAHERVVNSSDTHPSPKVNKLVAEELKKRVLAR